jgi:ATP-dependent Clp protease ATP-binding subunit ClpA
MTTFSEEVQGVLHRAAIAATEAGHAEVTPQHIALELIVEDEASTYLMRCGTDLVAVESRLRDHLAQMEPPEGPDEDAQPDAAFHRVIEAAIERTEEDGRDCIMLRDLFIALIDERGSLASDAILEATRDPDSFDDLRHYRDDDE